VWWVMLQADAKYRADPRDFDKVFVRSRFGKMVPLSALITVHYVAAPKLLERFNGFPAVKVTGNPAPGYSSGQALATMEEVARETLPGDFAYAWAGQALQEKGAGGTSAIAFIAGLIVVFLLLAAQFEKWTLPLAVLLTVPVAILGALTMTWAAGLENDVYFQVGLITLVGLSAKNAILICEVAIEHVHAGMSVLDAALEASRAGLRPGLRAAGTGQRPGRQQPAFDRHRRDRRHHGLDLHRHLLRPAVLLDARKPERKSCRKEGGGDPWVAWRRSTRRGSAP
jgi:multidrug efflux pump subunit AcrB